MGMLSEHVSYVHQRRPCGNWIIALLGSPAVSQLVHSASPHGYDRNGEFFLYIQFYT